MPRVLRGGFFAFGCLLTAFAIVWMVAGLLGVIIAPRTRSQALIGFTLYVIVMLPTLGPWVRKWPPFLTVTPARIATARILLLIAALISVSAIVIVIAARVTADPSLLNVGSVWLLGSLMLMNGVYVAIYWAYRPENVFGPTVTAWGRNPLGLLLVTILRKTGVAKPLPDDDEL